MARRLYWWRYTSSQTEGKRLIQAIPQITLAEAKSLAYETGRVIELLTPARLRRECRGLRGKDREQCFREVVRSHGYWPDALVDPDGSVSWW